MHFHHDLGRLSVDELRSLPKGGGWVPSVGVPVVLGPVGPNWTVSRNIGLHPAGNSDRPC